VSFARGLVPLVDLYVKSLDQFLQPANFSSMRDAGSFVPRPLVQLPSLLGFGHARNFSFDLVESPQFIPDPERNTGQQLETTPKAPCPHQPGLFHRRLSPFG
jgi:hypothetical protein